MMMLSRYIKEEGNRDVHYTLSVTSQVLTFIPNEYIDPIFVTAFGRIILRNNYELDTTCELILSFYKIFPLLLSERFKDPYVFFLALLQVDDYFYSWYRYYKDENKEIVVEYEAMKQCIKELPLATTQRICKIFICELINWEWHLFRMVKALDLMDIGYKFNKIQHQYIWLLLSSTDLELKANIIDILITKYGYYHDDLMQRTELAPIDISIFTYCLNSVAGHLNVNEVEWMRDFLETMMIEDWEDSDKLIVFFARYSNFHEKVIPLKIYLTRRQWVLFYQYKYKRIDANDYLDLINYLGVV